MSEVTITFLMKFLDNSEISYTFANTDHVSSFYESLSFFGEENFVFCHKNRFLKKEQMISECIDAEYPVYVYVHGVQRE